MPTAMTDNAPRAIMTTARVRGTNTAGAINSMCTIKTNTAGVRKIQLETEQKMSQLFPRQTQAGC